MKVDMLAQLFRLQHDLQTQSFNVNFQRMLPRDRIQYIKDMKLALNAELQEALDETDWKPWTTRSEIRRDAYVSELVDALHFLMNMFLVLGDDPAELAAEVFERYCVKNRINAQRQAEGYDGVSTKCGVCRRALDDPAVACSRKGDQGFCAHLGADVNYISDETVMTSDKTWFADPVALKHGFPDARLKPRGGQNLTP